MIAPRILAAAVLAVTLGGAAARADAVVGQPAPAFTLTDTDGKPHTLAESKGKIVVLEWLNHDCPFVRKHYDSDNMQALQRKATAAGVVWLSIVSSAPGKQGNYPPAKANELTASKKAEPTAVLLDPDGTVGRAYGAKTTPHMYVIDAQGTVVYAGAIDDTPSTDADDVKTARNHVDAALGEVKAGTAVSMPTSTPYGCSVKY